MHPQVRPDYQGFLSEVLKKYTLIFGPDLVHSLLKDMKDVKIHRDGTVIQIAGAGIDVTKEILSSLHVLSDTAYQSIVLPLMQKDSELGKEIGDHVTLIHQTTNEKRQKSEVL